MIQNKFLGGVLLIAGTSIGAAMLAMPVASGLSGFFPSALILVVCWLVMTYSGFLLLEVTLWMGKTTNIISMSRRTLGPKGEAISWVVYLFLLYTLTTAYIAAGGPLLLDFIEVTSGYNLPEWMGPFPFLLIFGGFVYRGTRSVDLLNRFLTLGLALAYCLLIFYVGQEADFSLLAERNWKYLAFAPPVVITAFGYHIVIPSLCEYFGRDTRQLKKVVLIGSIIPLGIYLVWQALMLGMVPVEGADGLKVAYEKGSAVTIILKNHLSSPVAIMSARIVSFFAIVTSFIGVSLSLSDFLSDGLRINKSEAGKILICALTFIPPLIFSLIDPRAFFTALEYAGAFGVVGLLVILPVAMVWSGRYHHHLKGEFQTPGGKGVFSVILVIACSIILLELAHKLGLIGYFLGI